MNFRQIIFWGHLMSGLLIGSVLLVMAVTGALLAFEPQIVPFAEKNVREVRAPADGTERLSLNTLLAKAREGADGKQPSGLMLFSAADKSTAVQFGRGGGSLFLNPYDGEVLGPESKLHSAMHFVEDLHRKLALGETGKRVTGICNIAFLLMILSGLYLWWPKQWNAGSLRAILLFKRNLSGKARDWNWHNVIGFWSSPILLLTVVTGMIMSFAWANNLLFKMTGTEPPPPQQRPMGLGMKGPEASRASGGVGDNRGARENEKSRPPERVNLDAAFETLQRQFPRWQSVNFRLPGGPAQGPVPASPQITAIVVQKGSPSFFRDQLFLDPQTGAVIRLEPFAKQSRGRQARTWVKFLHTGEAWGLAGQALMFASALGAVLLVYTGFALSWRRFFRSK